MRKPQNSPEERINPDAEEGQREIPPLTRRVSVLLDLGVPDHLDDALLPSHIRMDDDGQSIICGALLIGCLESGRASTMEGKPVVVLNASEEDAEWLPKVSELATWGSKMVMLLLRLCWFGKEERWTQLKPVGQSDNLYQVVGKAVGYQLQSEEVYPWAVVFLEKPGGAPAQIHIPSYRDEATVKERCEAAMEGKRVWATGYWYASGAGRVFRVKEWSRVIDPPEGSALEEIAEIL